MNIEATFETPDGRRTLQLRNRQGWTLCKLASAGPIGITTLDHPAPRLSAYVHSLRERGFCIETEMEPHDGTYSGHHARYRLQQDVSIRVLTKGAQT
jgi:hypothetical protein